MTKSPSVTIETTSTDMFIVFDGKRIAKRGRPGTKQAGTWVPLEPGYMVRDVEEGHRNRVQRHARAALSRSLCLSAAAIPLHRPFLVVVVLPRPDLSLFFFTAGLLPPEEFDAFRDAFLASPGIAADHHNRPLSTAKAQLRQTPVK